MCGVSSHDEQRVFRADTGGYLDSLPDGRWIFSSEHLSSHLDSSTVLDFISFMHAYFDELQIVAFIRRQDFLLSSRYSEWVKNGAWQDFAVANGPAWVMNPLSMIDSWAAGMQQGDGLVVLPYLESFQSDPTAIIRAFESAVHLPAGTIEPGPNARSNRRLGAFALAALRSINGQILGASQLAHGLSREALIDTLQTELGGPPWDISAREARAVVEECRFANAALAAKASSGDWATWTSQVHTGLSEEWVEAAAAVGRGVELALKLCGDQPDRAADSSPRRIKWLRARSRGGAASSLTQTSESP